MIQANTEIERGGQAWAVSGEDPKVWMSEEQFRKMPTGFREMIRQELSYRERRGEKIEASLQVEGMDNALLEKLTVLAGDIKPLQDPEAKAIAVTVDTDDYGNPEGGDAAPQPGEKLTVTYVDEGYYEDSEPGNR